MKPNTDLVIRPGLPTDLNRIVALHVSVWRETYGALAPVEAVQALDEAARRPRWIAALQDGSTLAAVIGEELVGFAQVGPPSHPALGARGEVKHLYVDAAFARRGIGARLLLAARRLLGERGYSAAALGVVVGNDPALRFYEAQGGRVVGRYRDPGPIWPSDNLVVAWDEPVPVT